ncbi:MAG: hypothetical protein HC852_13920 [Acaryochloridaceae cyanobacterium RU_4_10]|jgi:hypothetical protein|nr:hypothetical protein [Acaryochloridaceae cyanobacterium RU_4_10]
MYTVEVTLRGTPLTLSVQRKELSDAETLYRSIVDSIQATPPKLIELTCEKESDKKIGVFGGEISAVQISEKSGGATSGRSAGFGAMLTQ